MDCLWLLNGLFDGDLVRFNPPTMIHNDHKSQWQLQLLSLRYLWWLMMAVMADNPGVKRRHHGLLCLLHFLNHLQWFCLSESQAKGRRTFSAYLSGTIQLIMANLTEATATGSASVSSVNPRSWCVKEAQAPGGSGKRCLLLLTLANDWDNPSHLFYLWIQYHYVVVCAAT